MCFMKISTEKSTQLVFIIHTFTITFEHATQASTGTATINVLCIRHNAIAS